MLIEQLQKMKKSRRQNKAVVFTQYPAYLDVLQAELSRHGFRSVKLLGNMTLKNRGKVLDEFRTDAGVSVFILSSRAGACGLTLISASYVFIMEPFSKCRE